MKPRTVYATYLLAGIAWHLANTATFSRLFIDPLLPCTLDQTMPTSFPCNMWFDIALALTALLLAVGTTARAIYLEYAKSKPPKRTY